MNDIGLQAFLSLLVPRLRLGYNMNKSSYYIPTINDDKYSDRGILPFVGSCLDNVISFVILYTTS